MYPRNAAVPERVAVGAVVLIADGTVQTSGVSITVVPQGGTTAAGLGTTTYEQGVVFYAPTQAETNYTSFIVTAYKTACIPVSATVVTTASVTPGKVVLSGETHTSAVIPTVTTVGTLTTYTGNTPQTGDSFALIGTAGAGLTNINLPNQTMDIIGNITGNLSGSIGSVTAGVTVSTNSDKTGYSLTQAFPANFADMSISLTTGLVDITQTAADKTWSTASRVLTAGTNIALAKGVGVTGLNDIAATDIVSAGAITTLAGAVVNVDLVDVTTTNTDMRGTNNAALATALATAQADLDVITGATGVNLLTATQASIDSIQTQIGTAGAGLTDLGGMSLAMKAQVQVEATDSLNAYDPPTNTEMIARTPSAAQLAYMVDNSATGVPVTFTTAGGSTTVAILTLVDGSAASATNDQYNGRLLVFNNGTLKDVVTDITDYVGSTGAATITAIPFAPTSTHTARLI